MPTRSRFRYYTFNNHFKIKFFTHEISISTMYMQAIIDNNEYSMLPEKNEIKYP